MSLKERIKRTEEELEKTPVNKGTEAHIGRLKARIARLKHQEETKKGSGKGLSYAVKKSGDATVLIVGFPSVGKSTLLNKLTNAQSKVGSFDFTTLDVVPGVLNYRGAKIQLFDIPGLVEGAAEGKGRGKEVLSVVRTADLVLVMIDARHPEQLETIEKELEKAGIRLNQKPPRIDLEKHKTGKLVVKSLVKNNLDTSLVKQVCQEMGFNSGQVVLREKVSVDELVDVLAGNRVYLPGITVVNKTDLEKPNLKGLHISAREENNLNRVKEVIYKKLDFMRVYLKEIGKEPDKEEPMIVTSGSTVGGVATRIHGEVGDRLKYARIWGPSAKFEGQKVGDSHVLEDKDVVELHIER